MQRESEVTPFRPTKSQPVLRLDDAGRRAAARELAVALSRRRECIYSGNERLMIDLDQKGPNVIIDRTGSTPNAA